MGALCHGAPWGSLLLRMRLPGRMGGMQRSMEGIGTCLKAHEMVRRGCLRRQPMAGRGARRTQRKESKEHSRKPAKTHDPCSMDASRVRRGPPNLFAPFGRFFHVQNELAKFLSQLSSVKCTSGGTQNATSAAQWLETPARTVSCGRSQGHGILRGTGSALVLHGLGRSHEHLRREL